MKNDNLEQFKNVRTALLSEKQELEARLHEINEALGQNFFVQARRGRPTGAGLTLKDAVLQVIAGKSLTKQEILTAVENLGYRFSTANPINSLGVILYGRDPKFKNDRGRFSLSPATLAALNKENGTDSSPEPEAKPEPKAESKPEPKQKRGQSS